MGHPAGRPVKILYFILERGLLHAIPILSPLRNQGCFEGDRRRGDGPLVSGVPSAESAAREIREELGLEVSGLSMTGTYWFEKKDMLMIGFLARVNKKDFLLSQEVDQAVWAAPEQALELVRPGSIACMVVEEYLRRLKQGGVVWKE